MRGREHSLFHKVRVCPIYADVWILGMCKVMVKEDRGLCQPSGVPTVRAVWIGEPVN